MKITYRMNQQFNSMQLAELYEMVYQKPVNYGLIKNAISHSLYSIGAYDGSQLIGLVRVIGDGHSVVIIQNLMIAKDYEEMGIESNLINRVLSRYKSVPIVMMYADDDPKKLFASDNTRTLKVISSS